ncbi:MAG: hypothetical protein K9G33_00660 [Sneathiella sp.]|nr:hypothetical protein [Sneathiella sp.]
MPALTASQTTPVDHRVHLKPRFSHFTIQSAIEPSVLSRIVENFALRNLVPENLHARRENDHLVISLTIAGLDPNVSEHLRMRMQNILPVNSVELELLE